MEEKPLSVNWAGSGEHCGMREDRFWQPSTSGCAVIRCRFLQVEKLGPYEILSPLGAGGMGEVYNRRADEGSGSVGRGCGRIGSDRRRPRVAALPPNPVSQPTIAATISLPENTALGSLALSLSPWKAAAW